MLKIILQIMDKWYILLTAIVYENIIWSFFQEKKAFNQNWKMEKKLK